MQAMVLRYHTSKIYLSTKDVLNFLLFQHVWCGFRVQIDSHILEWNIVQFKSQINQSINISVMFFVFLVAMVNLYGNAKRLVSRRR